MAPQKFSRLEVPKNGGLVGADFGFLFKKVGDFQVISAVGGFRVENQPCQFSALPESSSSISFQKKPQPRMSQKVNLILVDIYIYINYVIPIVSYVYTCFLQMDVFLKTYS